MAKLTYAEIIERDQLYCILADLGLRLDLADKPKLMPRLVNLVAPEHIWNCLHKAILFSMRRMVIGCLKATADGVN